MIEIINNITAEANAVWLAATGLFVILAIMALGVFLLIGAFSGERGRTEAVKRVFTVIFCALGFAAAGSLITWSMGIGV